MNSFRPEKLASLAVPHRVIRLIAEIHECRGLHALWTHARPQVLDALRIVAVSDSVESSSRMENVTVGPRTFDRIVRRNGAPDAEGRNQAELAGNRDALDLIHGNAAELPPTENTVLFLHGKLMGHTPGGGGRYKSAPNDIVERRADGSSTLRLRTVSPALTASHMRALHDGLAQALDRGDVVPLLLVPLYVHDLLAIHPFADGNGRIARLMTVLLLHRLEFDVGRHISLERLIEATKETYYESLARSDAGWADGAHDPIPFAEYMLSIVLRAYRELKESVKADLGHGGRARMVERAIDGLPTAFRTADVFERCPLVKRDTVRAVMQKLKTEGRIAPDGRGRAATWRKL